MIYAVCLKLLYSKARYSVTYVVGCVEVPGVCYVIWVLLFSDMGFLYTFTKQTNQSLILKSQCTSMEVAWPWGLVSTMTHVVTQLHSKSIWLFKSEVYAVTCAQSCSKPICFDQCCIHLCVLIKIEKATFFPVRPQILVLNCTG